jgi:hypothetical protein
MDPKIMVGELEPFSSISDWFFSIGEANAPATTRGMEIMGRQMLAHTWQ